MDDDGCVPSRSPSTSARALVPLTVVAAAFVVFAAVAVPIELRHDAEARSPRATVPRPLPANTGDGVPVEGVGTLLRDGRDMRLCAEVATTLSKPPSTASCGAVWVPVTGVPKRWFRNKTTEGQAFSDPVRVEGSYRGGNLKVSAVRAADPSELP